MQVLKVTRVNIHALFGYEPIPVNFSPFVGRENIAEIISNQEYDSSRADFATLG